MCNVPTEQEPHTPVQNPLVSYHYPRRFPPLSTDHHGSDYWPTKHKGQRCYPYHCRPRVFKGSLVSPVFYYNYWTRNSCPIPQEHLPLVWPPQKGHNRQRPSIHLSLRKRTSSQNRGPTEHLNGLPSPNRWTIRMKEPMDRTIPPYSHINGP